MENVKNKGERKAGVSKEAQTPYKSNTCEGKEALETGELGEGASAAV